MRTNAFQAPLEVLQILTWVLLATLVSSFYAFLVPPMEAPLSIVIGIIYGLLAASCLTIGGIVSAIDPIDPLVACAQKPSRNISRSGNGTDQTFCFLCQLHVKRGSKHCRYCDKCVDNFDHHCKWLNNCIGKANYRYFVALLLFTLGLTGLQFGVSIWFIVLYHTNNRSFEGRVLSSYPHLDTKGYIIAVYCFGCLCLPFICLLAQLIGFHTMLMKEGITTYDYIIREQKRDRERKHKAHELQQAAGGGATSGTKRGRGFTVMPIFGQPTQSQPVSNSSAKDSPPVDEYRSKAGTPSRRPSSSLVSDRMEEARPALEVKSPP